MAGKQPKERFDDGYKIGSTSDPTRPISATDLVILQDVSETDLTKAVRTGLVSDIFKDISNGAGDTINIAGADGFIHQIVFANGLMTSYSKMEGEFIIDGTGTELDPYLIDTPQKLNWIRNHPSSYYKQTADIDISTVYANWLPIGSPSAPFSGTYDGDGYTISNLTSIVTGAKNHAGLFNTIKDATFQNMIFDNITLVSDYYCGVISGNATGKNKFTNIVITDATMIGQICGGLLGYNYDLFNNFTECYAEVDITATGYGGGLCGYCASVITECYTEGTITSAIGGGLIGSAASSTTITDSHSDCAIIASEYGGGLVGILNDGAGDETMTCCFATGAISGTGTLGGLICKANFGLVEIVKSYWDTETTGQATSGGGVGKTTAQMKTASLYESWDTDVWQIVNGFYPVLKWSLPA